MNPIIKCGDPAVGSIEFNWHLTNWCNYKCSYCPVLTVITNNFKKDDHAESYKSVLERLSTIDHPFKMCITGGEPTLNPNILEILEGLAKLDNCHQIAVMTNLSRSVAFYKSIDDLGNKYPMYDNSKIVIMASYHPEYFNDKFAEKAIELSKQIKRFQVSINFSDKPKNWDNTVSVLEMLKSNNIKMKPTILSKNSNYHPIYVPKFYETFKKYLEESPWVVEVDVEFQDGTKTRMKDYEIEQQKLHKFTGYMCTPIYYSIDIAGQIKNICTNNTIVGSLTKDNLVKKLPCPKDTCLSRRLLTFYKEKV
jgi:organic radical activating enzyme